MKKLLLILLVALLSHGTSDGAILTDAIFFAEDEIILDGDWELVAGDPVTEIGSRVQIDFEAPNFLSAVTGTIAAGYEWSLVTEGETLDPAYFMSNTAFASNFLGGGFEARFMTVSHGAQFTWGYWHDIDENSVPNAGDWIGWSRVEYLGPTIDHLNGRLRVIESYTDDSGRGIVVGQMTAIPEPTAQFLLGGALLAGPVLARRRKGK